MTGKFEIDFLEDYSQPSLLEELRRVQKIVGDRPVTQADIKKYGRASWSVYFSKFGSFSKALIAAGLDTSRRVNVTEEELLNGKEIQNPLLSRHVSQQIRKLEEGIGCGLQLSRKERNAGQRVALNESLFRAFEK